ncbi:MAG: CHC2 zinc finger domain-containing protein, partial [Bacteroidales bacterium]
MIPPQTVQQILETARIDEVVADYVNLRKRGSNLLGLCPFHQEKTPSFMVSPAKGIFK